MNLENYFWCYPEALPSRLCDDIIRMGESLPDSIGVTGNFNQKILSDEQKEKLFKHRKSKVVWMDDKWLYKEIHPWIRAANQAANWNFDWDFSEPCQFTKYSKTEHYDWHTDSGQKPYNTPNNLFMHNKVRKLSVTVSLADGDSYEGGDFEFDFRNRTDSKSNTRKLKEARKKGSIIVFPSFVWHRVSPVTSGTRYSLVMWSLGAPFK